MRPVGFAHVTRVAEVGSLTARAKMTLEFFVWREFAIFAKNASLQYAFMQYTPCINAHLAQETLFLTPKSTFVAQSLPKTG